MTRLAGVEAALEMCVFGEPIRAEEAKRLGIVDRIAGKDLLEDAIQYAHEASRLGLRRTRDIADKLGICVLLWLRSMQCRRRRS